VVPVVNGAPLREFSARLARLEVGGLAAGDPASPLVILLHGFPELSESWREVLPTLAAAGLHAVAPDLRGYGRTGRPRGGYDLDSLAADVVSLIDHFAPGRAAHLVGHDWGGAIAYHVAAFHPSRVERLAVVNCPHPSVLARRLWRPAQLRRSWYMFFFQLPVLPERALAADGGRRVPALIRKAMTDPARLTEERAEAYARNMARPGAARAALAYYRQMVRGLSSPTNLRRLFGGYPEIPAPFRLIWGTDDVALGRELTVDLGGHFARPPVVDYLHGVGHFAPLEAPDRVAASLVEHLAA
jgi:pimeloyl-ACP methyl ester carboxylesterase